MEKTIFWREHDEEQRRSGLSVRAYCELHAIKAHRLAYWRQKLGSQKPVKAASFFRVIESKPLREAGAVARLMLGRGVILECLEWPEAQWVKAMGRES